MKLAGSKARQGKAVNLKMKQMREEEKLVSSIRVRHGHGLHKNALFPPDLKLPSQFMDGRQRRHQYIRRLPGGGQFETR